MAFGPAGTGHIGEDFRFEIVEAKVQIARPRAAQHLRPSSGHAQDQGQSVNLPLFRFRQGFAQDFHALLLVEGKAKVRGWGAVHRHNGGLRDGWGDSVKGFADGKTRASAVPTTMLFQKFRYDEGHFLLPRGPREPSHD